MRYVMTIAYHGDRFSGWQRQPAVATIQGAIEAALGKMCGGREMSIAGASRTDAGVHAEGQVAIFDYPAEGRLSAWDFLRGLNALTPDAITIRSVEPCSDAFHPRFLSNGKRYRYRAWLGPQPPPWLRDRVWQIRARGPLDLARMRDAASRLHGEHDFDAFRASDCEARSTRRHIHGVTVDFDGAGFIEPTPAEAGAHFAIEVRGNAFLKNMVRIIAGTIVEVGLGQRTPASVSAALERRDRCLAGRTAPAQGLTLVAVYFDDALNRWCAAGEGRVPMAQLRGESAASGVRSEVDDQKPDE